jgi:hypothetical protein
MMQLHIGIQSQYCFWKWAHYAGIKIFNTLPSSLESLTNEKAQFEVALKRDINTHPLYSVDEFLLSKNYLQSIQRFI